MGNAPSHCVEDSGSLVGKTLSAMCVKGAELPSGYVELHVGLGSSWTRPGSLKPHFPPTQASPLASVTYKNEFIAFLVCVYHDVKKAGVGHAVRPTPISIWKSNSRTFPLCHSPILSQ